MRLFTSRSNKRAPATVSVLVAAWNEAPHIADFIHSFRLLRYAPKELVLCAGGADGTLSIAQQGAGDAVTVLPQQPGEGKQRALRRAFAHATGEIIFLTDADCLLSDSAFERTVEPLLHGQEVAASGTFKPRAGQRGDPWVLYQWSIELFVTQQAPMYVQGLQGRNCAITRRALEAVGAFEEEVPVGTDFFLAKKLTAAHYPIRHVPDSAVETTFPGTFAVYIRKQSRWIRNLLVHGPYFREWGEVRAALRTMGMGVGMLLWPLTFPRTRRWGVGVWLLALGYGIAARLRYLRFARRFIERDLTGVAARVPLYMLVDFIAWAAALVDYLRPGTRKRW